MQYIPAQVWTNAIYPSPGLDKCNISQPYKCATVTVRLQARELMCPDKGLLRETSNLNVSLR